MPEQKIQEFSLHIAGQRTAGRGDLLESVNPYTNKTWAHVRQATIEQADAAIAAAAKAAPAWGAALPGIRRAELMQRLADILDSRAEELATIESTDNGKIIRETKAQMHFSARNYRFMASMADKLSGETKPLDNPALFDYTLREPLGVAVLITAWNSPISLLANKLAPALAAGNTIVVKPSPFTAASTLKFAEYIVEAGFPPGVFNVVVGDQEVGEYLTTDARVDRVSFTGSVGVGKIIARQAADQLTPVTLELGGKSANIIFADADLDRAIPGAVSGIFAASGQTCIAGSRLLVHRSIVDEVVDGIVKLAESIRCGDPVDPATDMGPVAHARQHEHILRMLAAAESSGARLATGGVEASEQLGGLFVAPTVFTDVKPDSDLAQQEVFGPALAVIPFDSDDEAVEIANSTEFGLASGIWTQNLSRAHSVAKLLRAGTVWVNTYRTSAAQAPFGGVGHSGYGRERGIEALLEFTRFKNVMIDLSNDIRDPFTARF